MHFRHLICLACLSVPIATVNASDNVELNSFLTIGRQPPVLKRIQRPQVQA